MRTQSMRSEKVGTCFALEWDLCLASLFCGFKSLQSRKYIVLKIYMQSCHLLRQS